MGEWISVEDRLPESGKHVLVCCEIRSFMGKKQYICDGFYAEYKSIRGSGDNVDECAYIYDEDEDEYSSVVIEDFVTHWMPLPEPPKEV